MLSYVFNYRTEPPGRALLLPTCLARPLVGVVRHFSGTVDWWKWERNYGSYCRHCSRHVRHDTSRVVCTCGSIMGRREMTRGAHRRRPRHAR